MSDRLPPVDHPFSVLVRPRHARQAVPDDPLRCVIAVALKEAFPDLRGVIVGPVDALLSFAPGHGLRRGHDGAGLVADFDAGFALAAPVRVTFAAERLVASGGPASRPTRLVPAAFEPDGRPPASTGDPPPLERAHPWRTPRTPGTPGVRQAHCGARWERRRPR